MTGFVPVISRMGRRRAILFNLLGTTASTWIFLIQKKKTGRVTKVLFSDNRAYVLRYSQIYCFDMNFVQFYLLVGMDFKKSFRTMFI